MRRLSIASALLVTIVGAAAFVPNVASAQYDLRSLWHPNIPPLDQSAFASDDDVAAAVGDVSVAVDCPEGAQWEREKKRGARVTLSNPGVPSVAVLSTVLRNALFQVWTGCNTQMGSFGFGVGYIDVYAPDHAGSDPELVYRVQNFIDLVASEGWSSKQQFLTREQQAAQEAAQQQAAAQAAQQQAAAEEAAREQAAEVAEQQAEQAAQAQAQQQADAEARQRERDQTVQWIEETGRRVLTWGVALSIVLFLFAKRTVIARFYYFYFHPHPAAPLVRSALATGTVLDGKALATALSEVPPGNPILRAVRLEQAESLFQQMKHASEEHLRKQKVEAEKKAKTDLEHAAIYSIQEAVALAAVALERAKELYRASRQVGART